jgi:uncharacterized protein (TIGR00369 family)
MTESARTDIWRERPRGGLLDPRLLGLTGLERMRSLQGGEAPAPPVNRLTGAQSTEVGPGIATFAMPVTPWLLDPHGLVSLGTAGILADTALGCAIMTALPPGVAFTTGEISLNALRPITTASRQLVARGRLVHSGRSLGLSDVHIEDGAGRLVVYGTSRCILFPPREPPPSPPASPARAQEQAVDSPDPYLRDPAGAPIPQAAWADRSGLEILQALARDELPAPPLSSLTGLRLMEAADGTTTFSLPASGWLCNPAGTVQGGVLAMLVDAALGMAVQTTAPAGTAIASLDLKVNLLRPAPPDGRDLVARANVVHRGRTLAVAHGEVTDADGRRVALATSTVTILEGRTATLSYPVVQEDEALT